MNYNEALVFLDNLQQHKIKLGLEAMDAFLQRLGRPERKLRFVHVAGTNGKGSVSVTLLTMLTQAGYRVGLYTSPHLDSVRERFRIGESYISKEDFARCATRVANVLGAESITYFECATAIALLWFADAELDLVILETGLGGRLDATNVVQPQLSLLTSIAMDHEAYLGNTLAAIAREKAGIIKRETPVIAAQGTAEVEEVLIAAARQHQAPLYLEGRDFTYHGESNQCWDWLPQHQDLGEPLSELCCRLQGAYQRENTALCLAALALLRRDGFEVSETEIRKALTMVHWPGRLELLQLPRKKAENHHDFVRYLLDGAHNPAGVSNLAATITSEYQYKKLFFVWGAMADKDFVSSLNKVLSLADSCIFTSVGGGRAASLQQFSDFVSYEYEEKCYFEADVPAALEWAEILAGPEDLIVVAGSLYLVGAARKHLVGSVVH